MQFPMNSVRSSVRALMACLHKVRVSKPAKKKKEVQRSSAFLFRRHCIVCKRGDATDLHNLQLMRLVLALRQSRVRDGREDGLVLWGEPLGEARCARVRTDVRATELEDGRLGEDHL